MSDPVRPVHNPVTHDWIGPPPRGGAAIPPDPTTVLRRLTIEARGTLLGFPSDGSPIWKRPGRVPTIEGLRQLRAAGCVKEISRSQWRPTPLGMRVRAMLETQGRAA